MEKCRLVFTGSGGQGVITAAIVLAEAAVLYENLNATQAQSYGPEARGGATRSDVIIAKSEIRYPKVMQPDVLVCLTQEAYGKFSSIVRPGGVLLTDSRFVAVRTNVDAQLVQLPMYQAVLDQIGKPIVFNICVLGAILGLIDLIKPESVMNVLEKRFPRGVELNRQALTLGLELGKQHRREE